MQHVWAHSIREEPLFRDPVDRRIYLETLEVVTVESGWNLLAYCQMTTHVHLLIETPQANLGEGMQRLHGSYAVDFNKRHGLRGHLFESRYGNELQKTDAQLKVTAAYVVNNPVAAKMTTRAEEWRWSSHPAVVNDVAPRWLAANRLLGFFEAGGGDPLDRYTRFVAGEILPRAGLLL